MASSGYQPSDDETTNIGDSLSGTAEQSQNQRADTAAGRLAAALAMRPSSVAGN